MVSEVVTGGVDLPELLVVFDSLLELEFERLDWSSPITDDEREVRRFSELVRLVPSLISMPEKSSC